MARRLCPDATSSGRPFNDRPDPPARTVGTPPSAPVPTPWEREARVVSASAVRKGKERMDSPSHPTPPVAAPLHRPPIWAWPLAILAAFRSAGWSQTPSGAGRPRCRCACVRPACRRRDWSRAVARDSGFTRPLDLDRSDQRRHGRRARCRCGACRLRDRPRRPRSHGRPDRRRRRSAAGIGAREERIPGAAWWAAANPPAWALGWLVTTYVISSNVKEQIATSARAGRFSSHSYGCRPRPAVPSHG